MIHPFIAFALVSVHMERVGSCLAIPSPLRMTYFGDNMAKDCTKAEAETDTRASLASAFHSAITSIMDEVTPTQGRPLPLLPVHWAT